MLAAKMLQMDFLIKKTECKKPKYAVKTGTINCYNCNFGLGVDKNRVKMPVNVVGQPESLSLVGKW